MTNERRTTLEEAKRVGDKIGVDRGRFELEQFRIGMDVEYEHGALKLLEVGGKVSGSSPLVGSHYSAYLSRILKIGEALGWLLGAF